MKKIILTIIIMILMTSTMAIAGPKCTTNGGYPATVSADLLEEAITYVSQGDKAALQQLLNTGYVIILKDGITVYRQDVTWGGKVEIRLPGHRQTFWTVMEAIDCE